MFQTEMYRVEIEIKAFGESIQREQMIFVKSFSGEWISTTASRIIREISKIEYGDPIEGLEITVKKVRDDEIYSGIKAEAMPYRKLIKEIKEKIKKIMKS